MSWLFGEEKNRMTNREWLNSLSDEELAKVVMGITCCTDTIYCNGDCADCFLNWLKKERVEE